MQYARGFPWDFQEGVRYFKVNACGNYGVCLRDGRGVSQSHEDAACYLKLSVDHEHCYGQ